MEGMDEWVIRELTAEETRDAGFRRLLWLAAEVDDRELDRIVAAELPRLTALGAFDGGRLLGFVAFDAGSDPVTVEYIAAAEAAQGRGIGRELLGAVRERLPGRPIAAQTDDDAVGFYRRLGFTIGPGDPDPRWPDRPRYDCLLAPGASGPDTAARTGATAPHTAGSAHERTPGTASPRTRPAPPEIRAARGPAEYPRLVEIWRSAVRATHDFLADEDFARIESALPTSYLPAVTLLIAERGGRAVGFAGVAGDALEMLFVEADARGTGVGSALLDAAITRHGVVRVDVNEQNPGATGFYLSRGFAQTGRSALDGDGRPYPVLHLSRE